MVLADGSLRTKEVLPGSHSDYLTGRAAILDLWAEKYLPRLKVIDTGYAPDDLKRAFADYTFALEQSIDAAKAGRDTTPFVRRMDEAKQRVVAIFKRYD